MAEIRLKSILRELWGSGPGRTGIVMLSGLLLTSLLILIFFPANFGSSRWSNPSVWADNPKSSPPAWANLFYRDKYPRHVSVKRIDPVETNVTRRAVERIYAFDYELRADRPPSFLSFKLQEVEYARRPPVISWYLIGPDGREIALERFSVNGPRSGEESPYKRYDVDARRSVVGSDERVFDDLVEFFGESYGSVVTLESLSHNVEAGLFGTPDEDGNFSILPGEYRIEARVLTVDENDTIASLEVVFGGGIYGAMGTDALGRDLAAGLLFGLPIALLIGIATSVISTMLGMTLGMISGYVGGWPDLIIQRAADIVANIPVLPLLIFLVFIGGSQLWLILLVLVAFSWPGLTIMVRTMVLQLRTGQEVEAARALGAGNRRIILRHILPHAASYVLAQLVFFAPSAILAEAGLSFLGLGDPRIPTWGQILEYGFRTGAVFLGYWWWVVPPGLLIVITAVTFMFLALGLEPVVDPRLRGKRTWHF
jgi:peptide/nickel transport system permease protein